MQSRRSRLLLAVPAVFVANGQTYLGRCASVLSGVAQPGDWTARTDPTELALLAVGADALAARAMLVRLRQAARAAQLSACVGAAPRRAGEDLTDTWLRARALAGADLPHGMSTTGPAPAPRR